MNETLEPTFSIGLPGLEPERSKDYRWAAVLLGLLGLMTAIILPNFQKCHCGSPLTGCKSNLKNIATALEMYASDHDGHYPVRLGQLTPVYLKTIPTCPAAGRMTYINYHASQKPDNFHVACVGDNHAKSYAHYGKSSYNFPRYRAEDGLIEHP